jgi:DNA invertase Pin-like site-specific DNA recombinase
LKRAIGYVRVSSVAGRDGESYRTVEQQKRRILELAAASGYSIVQWVVEEDVSGRKVKADGARFDRPAWDAAEELVLSGAMAAIVVYDLKRFGRKTEAMLATAARLLAAGGELIVGDLPVDLRTPTGRAMLTVSSAFATLDGDVIAERFELSKRDAWTSGIYLAKRAPFGYRFADEELDRRLVVVELEAAIVVELFELRAAGGSWTELAELFEARTGRSSTRTSVRDLVHRRAYLGESPIGGAFTRSPNGHAAIVTPALFERAQRPSARWKATTTRERFDNRAKSMLAGIARCGTCGSKMSRTTAGTGRAYYRCASRTCAGRASVLLEELDRHVEELVLEWAEPVVDEPVELESIGAELIDERRRELLAVVEAAKHELETFVVGSRGLSASLIAAGAAAREEDVELAVQELEAFDAANVDAVARSTVRTTLAASWPGLDDLEKRELLSVVLDAVVVDRGRVVNSRRARLQPVAELAELVFATVAIEDDAKTLEKATT